MSSKKLLTAFVFSQALLFGCAFQAGKSQSSLNNAASSGSAISTTTPVKTTSYARTFNRDCPSGGLCNYSGAAENSSVSLSCAAGTISVQSATYGAGGKTESCADYVSSVCGGQSSCQVAFSNNACGGDPDFGVVKNGSATISCSTSDPYPNKMPARLMPVVEYIHYQSGVRDIIYDKISGIYAPIQFLPTHALGLAFAAGTRGDGLIPIYRCAGNISAEIGGWNFSFYSSSKNCTGNPFDGGVVNSAGEAMVIYAAPPKGGLPSIPVYRYKVAGEPTTLLSTVPPLNPQGTQDNLAIMRFQLDPTLGTTPIGYMIKMDDALDGNQRLISGLSQNFCYGILSYQTTCPSVDLASSSTWQLTDLRSGASLLSSSFSSVGQFSMSAEQISQLLDSGTVKSNAPLLLTIQNQGNLVAAKNIRILRTPFISQYDNNVVKDDDGETTAYPTASSALLMGNQMIANTAYTDPLVSRTFDPALYDGIVYAAFYGNVQSNYTPEKLDAKVSHGFQVLDAQGVLVGAEIPGGSGFYGAPVVWNSKYYGDYVFPFDPSQATFFAPGNVYPDLAAQWFDPGSGQFKTFGQDNSQDLVQTTFVPDLANPNAVTWLSSGIQSYLLKLYANGVHPAFISFSENMLQFNGSILGYDNTNNNSRLPYYQSPTFSEMAYQNFRDWLVSCGAPASFVALPVLPADYAAAVAGNNPNLYRIQSAAPDSSPYSLWWYWSIWRRALYSGTLGQLAAELKAFHSSQLYTRAPLSIIMYQYVSWYSINGAKFDLQSDTTWPLGYMFQNPAPSSSICVSGTQSYSDGHVGLSNGDTRFLCVAGRWHDCGWELTDTSWDTAAASGQQVGDYTCNLAARQWVPSAYATHTVFVDQGEDLLLAGQLHPGAFDYFVGEVKDVNNADAVREAQRMVALKASSALGSLAKIGLHVELEAPYLWDGPYYTHINMSQVFPNSNFKSPAFDMVWTWEAQCEYLMSMKTPDATPGENVDVEIGANGFETLHAGGYAGIESTYSAVTGPYCLYRHQHYNLAQTCANGSCPDTRPQSNLRDNINRFLTWRYAYLTNQ